MSESLLPLADEERLIRVLVVAEDDALVVGDLQEASLAAERRTDG